MVGFDLDSCLRFVNNKYELILLAKTRAIEILSGASQPLIQKELDEKSFFTALKEIEGGLLDYSSMSEKFMTSVKNEIVGILVNTDSISDKEKKQFDETSIFAQIFQNLGMKEDNETDSTTDVFDDMIQSAGSDFLNAEDDEEGFSSLKKSLGIEEEE